MTEYEREAYLRFHEKFYKKLHTILTTGNLVFMVIRRQKKNPKEFELVDINVFRHPVSFWSDSFDLMNYVEFLCKKHRIPIPGARSYAGAEHVNGVYGNFIETGDTDYRLYYSFIKTSQEPCGCLYENENEIRRLAAGAAEYCENCFFEKHKIKIQDIL